MRLRSSVPLLVLALASAAPAAQQGNTAAERFRAMDRNNDGVIDRGEWRGSDRSFEVHDWNRDNVLSGDELRRGRWNQQSWPDEPDERASTFADWTAQRFQDLDHNRDGRLTLDEWHFDRELFRRVDLDGDGSLSQREFLGVERDDDRGDRFVDLDTNRDGRVSGQEWHADPEVFGALDRDRDGFLSRRELTGPDDAPVDLFASLDVNRDGRVSRSEWHWSRASFDARDRNRDGGLSRDELAAAGRDGAAAPQTAAFQAGYDRGIQDGRTAGREDRERRNRWDLEGQRELEQADAGYAPVVGPRTEYQAGYREGFRRGYSDGFGPRR